MDLYNLSIVCKYYAETITKKDFKNRVIKEIDRRMHYVFRENYGKIKKFMIHHGAIIAGSFIVQCILDEYWESGIDICIPTKIDFSKKTEYGVTNDSASFTENTFKINLITIKTDNIIDYVKNHYNYNICKITYQYKDVDLDLNRISTDNLQIYNFDDITYRRTNICINVTIFDDKYFMKYYNRGFSFYMTDDNKKKILSVSDLHNIICPSMLICVTKIISYSQPKKSNTLFNKLIPYFVEPEQEPQKPDIPLDDSSYTFTIINNEICCYYASIAFGINRLYKIHKVKIPDNLVITPCHNICITKLLFPEQKHLHANLGIFILIEN
jgi:hypothetical protein